MKEERWKPKEKKKPNTNFEEPIINTLDTHDDFIDPVNSWISTAILKDFVIKVAILSTTGVSIWSTHANKAAESLIKYAGLIMAAPDTIIIYLS